MKYLFLLLTFLAGTASFAQKGKTGKKQQTHIDTYLDSLKGSGALEKETVGINGEKIDSFAAYPGGLTAWRKYLEKSSLMNVMNQALEESIPLGQYHVWVEMIVHEDGTVSDLKPITHFGYHLEEGVIKVVEDSGHWKPAISNGKPVASKVKYMQSFNFSME
jgi:hypothetical protein